jgi:hypothetical protein
MAQFRDLKTVQQQGDKKKKNPKHKKYRAMKYNGDDLYSWAVFYADDVRGYRSPIYEDMGITPIMSGCGREEAKHYIKQLEKKDAESIISTGESI